MPEQRGNSAERDLVLVLGDQLSLGVSSLRATDPASAVVLMAEVYDEATYVPHHKKKIAFIFSAMRHFAEELRAAGWQVDYTRLDDPDNAGSLGGEVERAIVRHRPARLIVTEPGEWRVAQMFADWQAHFDIPVEVLEDDRFLCSREDFRGWAEGRKSLRMEYFYRDMRRQTGLLMDGDDPEGGR